jgi:formiminoglutamase
MCEEIIMINVRDVFDNTTTPLAGPFTVAHSELPLILSVPHGGRYVLEEFADHLQRGRGMWIDMDWHTAELYPLDLGSSIVAHLAPQQVNLNRSWKLWEETGEWDPIDMKSLLADEVVLKEPYSDAERARLRVIAEDYHRALAHLIARMKEEHGYALVIDCHSMSSRALANTPDAGAATERADFVIGNLQGTSADPRVADIFRSVLETHAQPLGLRVVENDPYKGGYITQTYADPEHGVHVLQLELKKRLYMNEGLTEDEPHAFEMHSGFERTKGLLHAACTRARDEVHTILTRQ